MINLKIEPFNNPGCYTGKIDYFVPGEFTSAGKLPIRYIRQEYRCYQHQSNLIRFEEISHGKERQQEQ